MLVLYSVIGFIVFLCLFWMLWGSNYFLSSYNLTGVAEILPSDMSYLLFAIAIPVILLLMIVVIVYIAITNNQNRKIFAVMLDSQIKKTEGMQVMGKVLVQVRKLGLTNQFFTFLPFIFNDMSQFIADIIYKTGMDSGVVVDDALSKNGESRLYSICKIILEKRESTPHFDENLRRMVKKNPAIAGMISVFSDKYDKLLKVLEEYDVDGIVYRIIEEGHLGKVRNILLSALNAADISFKSFEEKNNIEINTSFLDNN